MLKHAWKLPYADNSFDRVISCGVLEHVPLVNASLLELNRVTEPGGYLRITFLPNQLSYTEFVGRHLLKRSWHQRLYTKARLKTKLLEHGFDPIELAFTNSCPVSPRSTRRGGLGRKRRRGRFSSWIRWRNDFGR
jgi:ubiquinone/menaquinone biosynthesis C-methylase UbiE